MTPDLIFTLANMVAEPPGCYSPPHRANAG